MASTDQKKLSATEGTIVLELFIITRKSHFEQSYCPNQLLSDCPCVTLSDLSQFTRTELLSKSNGKAHC